MSFKDRFGLDHAKHPFKQKPADERNKERDKLSKEYVEGLLKQVQKEVEDETEKRMGDDNNQDGSNGNRSNFNHISR